MVSRLYWWGFLSRYDDLMHFTKTYVAKLRAGQYGIQPSPTNFVLIWSRAQNPKIMVPDQSHENMYDHQPLYHEVIWKSN